VAIARCGLRRSEIVALNIGDIDLDSGAVVVRSGKGGKSRVAYLPKAGIPYLAWWFELRNRARVETEAVFLRLSKSDRILGDRLTDQAVLYILGERGKAAGLESFTPHDFRRTFVSDLLDAGNDIVTVQKLAGHSNPTTTAKYDRRGEKTKQAAAAGLSL
jgi:integrase